MKYQKMHPQPNWFDYPSYERNRFWCDLAREHWPDVMIPPDDMKDAVPWQDSEGIWYWRKEFEVTHEKYEFI